MLRHITAQTVLTHAGRNSEERQIKKHMFIMSGQIFFSPIHFYLLQNEKFLSRLIALFQCSVNRLPNLSSNPASSSWKKVMFENETWKICSTKRSKLVAPLPIDVQGQTVIPHHKDIPSSYATILIMFEVCLCLVAKTMDLFSIPTKQKHLKG